jgi:hypothetical protein
MLFRRLVPIFRGLFRFSGETCLKFSRNQIIAKESGQLRTQVVSLAANVQRGSPKNRDKSSE